MALRHDEYNCFDSQKRVVYNQASLHRTPQLGRQGILGSPRFRGKSSQSDPEKERRFSLNLDLIFSIVISSPSLNSGEP
jgi:hypothetical protein